jgi:hypothetical protein
LMRFGAGQPVNRVLDPKDEQDRLQNQADMLREQLKGLEDRLNELSQNKSGEKKS